MLVFQRIDQFLINALMDCFMKGVMNRLIHGRLSNLNALAQTTQEYQRFGGDVGVWNWVF